MKEIGITMGDPCGIGPELVMDLAAQSSKWDAHLRIYGDEDTFLHQCKIHGIERSDLKQIRFRPCSKRLVRKGDTITTRSRAEVVLATLDDSIKDALANETHALVTAPIDKKVVQTVSPTFSGHTSYLKDGCNSSRTVMLLDNTELRVALLTEHLPLKEVPAQISGKNLTSLVEVSTKALARYASLDHPRIAVAGVNPHAGEIGDCGEDQIIADTVSELSEKGYRIEGPLPADTLFGKARDYTWDLIISPYHDQGLVAAKYPGIHNVVNITLGLPFLRTSPGHGVAYDRVGTNQIDYRSFRRAFDMALKGRIA